jgi:hypothetical protein
VFATSGRSSSTVSSTRTGHGRSQAGARPARPWATAANVRAARRVGAGVALRTPALSSRSVTPCRSQ